MEALDTVYKVVSSAEGQLALAFVAEFALRFKGTEKALGLVHILGSVLVKTGSVLLKIAEASDKVLPQKIK